MASLASKNRQAKCRRADILILQPSIVEYRIPFYRELQKRFSQRILVLAGADTFKAGVVAQTDLAFDWCQSVQNKYFLLNSLCWQQGVLIRALRSAVCVVNINPRVLSTWLVILGRRILRRPIVGWGHLEGSTSNVVRKILRMLQFTLCTEIVLYTVAETRQAPGIWRKKAVIGLQNSSVSEDECRPVTMTGKDLIYVGRLEHDKNVDELVYDFANLHKSIRDDTKLHLVGGGSLEESIRLKYEGLIQEGALVLHGWIWNMDELRKLYEKCAFSVNPSYVGLSVIQSFSFGVPIITSRHENHSPEISACEEGFNTIFYSKSEAGAFARGIEDAFSEIDYWNSQRIEISAHIRKDWSVENMARNFSTMLEKVI